MGRGRRGVYAGSARHASRDPRCPTERGGIDWHPVDQRSDSRFPEGGAAIPDPAGENDAFDPELISELEGVVADSDRAASSAALDIEIDQGLLEALQSLRAGSEGEPALTEAAFLGFTPPQLAERCNLLIEACRRSPRRQAAQAVESFVVFFQALLPTLRDEPAREVKARFGRGLNH